MSSSPGTLPGATQRREEDRPACGRGRMAAQHPGDDVGQERCWATCGWQTHPTPGTAQAALAPRRHPRGGNDTQASLPAPGPLPSTEHCEVVVNTVTLRHVHPLPTPLQIPAPNTRQAKRKRTKVPGLRHHSPPACRALAQPETQDKGLGQSEEDEGQRVGSLAWGGHVRTSLGISGDLTGREARTGWQPSPPCTHTSLRKHLWDTCCIPHTPNITCPVPHPTRLPHTLSYLLQHIPQPSLPCHPHTPLAHWTPRTHTHKQLSGRKDRSRLPPPELPEPSRRARPTFRAAGQSLPERA